MNFKQAYQEMLNGKKIKRPGWGGYWLIEDGKVKIKLKTGKIIENDFNQETIANTLADDWEVINEEKKKMWEPKIKENYYLIVHTGRIGCYSYDDDDTDKRFQSIGNCFQTEEQAEFMVEKLKIIHELKTFAVENNEEEINWNDDGQKKFFLYYSYSANQVLVNYVISMKENPFNVYFTSESIAEKSVEAIGEERLIKYYFEVEEETNEF